MLSDHPFQFLKSTPRAIWAWGMLLAGIITWSLTGCLTTPQNVSVTNTATPQPTTVEYASPTIEYAALTPSPSLTPLPTRSETPTLTQSRTPTAIKEISPFTINELDAGKYLVYWEQGKNRFTLINPADSSSHWLMAADSPRAWLSPDGKKIAYYMQGKIQVYDLSTGVVSPIPQPKIFTAAIQAFGGLAWSPDGKMIAFAASTIQIEDGNVLGTEDFPSIWVSFLDENRFERLTWWLTMEANPAWSPDGRWLAFASDHDKVEWAQVNQVQANFAGDTDIYVLDITCLEQPDECLGKAQRITGGNFLEENGSRPIWSSDSDHVAYECGIQEHVDNSDLTKYQTDICLVDVYGNQINLTNTSDDRESLPAWSPDGAVIAFMRSYQFSEHDIYGVNLVSGETVNYTNTPAIEETSLLWSMDGKSIVYTDAESRGVYITSVEDGSTRQLTDRGSEVVFWLVVK